MNQRTNGSVVIGIDGGGTHTRVMVSDFEGKVMSYVENGASSVHKDLQAKHNVQEAIQEALRQANKEIDEVAALAGGFAGYDSESDLEWVLPLTEMEGLVCNKLHVNDAVVAHSGALLSEPGIIVISGTGSIIFAMNETGRQIRNYDLHQYAASAARFLAYDATYELLAGNIDESDAELIQRMLQYWKLASVEELAQLALNGFIADRRERNRRFAELAPFLTEAALQHSRLAQTVCDRAVHQIMVGVELLASYFTEPEVKVSLIGSVVNSRYFEQQLAIRMKAGNNKRYALVKPAFSPVAGAVLLALKQLDIPIGTELLANLALHPRSLHV
ncbi:ATPase [Paenibacillus mesophilus]|uniref:BadF/BadG/BcrA/BcrD ATPase family protein n=1 Tax=Paenibacillus mesophilus TaxID=2582849 RepID=UPI00110E01CA|nr:BadF/BadG/BcrA/BcrD ATPase family protein [Paenibacillus mesophilus]TMV46317.1 ATPase [Paenibacillus mesophilus]